MRSRHYLLALCLLLGCLSWANLAKAVTADVLVLYDNKTKTLLNNNPEAAVKGWFTQMNNWYRDSGVDIQIRLVATIARDTPNDTMNAVLSALRNDSNVAALRNQYGADLVTQLSKTSSVEYCGLGYVALDTSNAFNVTDPGCGAWAFIHELGHNMGLAHSRRQGDTTGAVYRYGLGHTVDNSFVTIMAYSYANTPLINRFSDPDAQCKGVPCGVPVGQANESHSKLALNNSKNTIAGFKPTTISDGGATAPSGQVIIRARHSNSCVDASGTGNGANVQQWGCWNGANQKWTFQSKGGGWYEIKGAQSGRCLDVAGISTANGTNIQLYNCSGGNNQQFKLTATDGGYYTLTARHSSGCIDIAGSSTGNGANVQQWGCSRTTNQQFKFN